MNLNGRKPNLLSRLRNICWAQWLLLLVFLLISLSACGGGEEQAPGAANELIMKMTVEAGVKAQLSVEAPSAEATLPPPPPEGSPAEPVVDAGQGEAPAVDVAAQETAVKLQEIANAEAAAAAATEAALAATIEPIRAEVASYGVDPAQGSLGFTHPPVTIEESDFEDFSWANQNLLTIARDFVFAADVTWSSAFAESGCGFAVRNDGNEENTNQYLIGLTRGAQGHVLFAEQVQGEVDLNKVTDIYANGIDPQFEWQNNTTNRIAIVGRGQEFTLYSNGTRLGTVTGQAGFEEGFVAFFALNRSGGVRCEFDNAWLWRMN